MKCPYDRSELLSVLTTLMVKISVYDEQHGVGSAERATENHFKSQPFTPNEINTLIAKINGISVETLIKSDNQDKLKEAFAERIIRDDLVFLRVEFGLTDLEAWAAVALEGYSLNRFLRDICAKYV